MRAGVSVHLVGGDMTDPRAVESLRIGKARSLLLLTNDELANVELAVQAQHNFTTDGGLPMLVRVADLDLMDRANRMLGQEGWAPCVNIHKAVAAKILRRPVTRAMAPAVAWRSSNA